MEILRFEEATSPAPKRKKSSKGFLTLSFVAVLFGVGSAFATTTVEINSGQGVSLGQGVTLAAACDSQIDIVPITAMTLETVEGKEVPTFYMTELQIKGIDAQPTTLPDILPKVTGCGDKFFDIQIFNPVTGFAYTCADLKPGANAVDEAGTLSTLTCIDDAKDDKLSFQVSPIADDEDREYKIVFDEAPSGISYITLVSRES
jgi:hypothetical protein